MSDAARHSHATLCCAPLGADTGAVSRHRMLTPSLGILVPRILVPRILAFGILAAGLLASGCSQHAIERGWSDPSKVQVQFYAPPGATVAIQKTFETSRHQVAAYGADHRLEHSPEEFAVFNLKSGRCFNFKYTTAEGFPGVSIYGELEVHKPRSEEARKFVRQTFVPIVLPSRYYQNDPEQYFPVRGPSGAGLDEIEVEHLKQGDLITKVYFIADLQRAWETVRMIDFHVDKLRSSETVLNSELELVDSRFESYRRESLYADPTIDPLAAHQDSTGASSRFIKIEAKRQGLENQRYLIRQQIEDLQNEKRIRTRLLDSMKIVNRRGSMVLATPESQWEYHDTKYQVGDARLYAGHRTGPYGEYRTGDIVMPALGEVVVVMRVGGRHKHWDDPRREMVAFSEDAEEAK